MCIGVGFLKEPRIRGWDVSKVCLWEFGVNVLTGPLLRSSVYHSGVAGGLAIIEDKILLDLDTSRGRVGQGCQCCLCYVRFKVGC